MECLWSDYLSDTKQALAPDANYLLVMSANC